VVSRNFLIGPGIHYYKLVFFVWADHHGRGKDLTAAENHNLLLVDKARLLVAQPFFQNWNPAIITISGLHILKFVFLEDFPVLLFEIYVFVLLGEYLSLLFKLLDVFWLRFVNCVCELIDG
jgi:hypothetical protein